MLFRVGSNVKKPGPAKIPKRLPGSLPSFGAPDRKRYITLEEVLDENGDPIRSVIDGLRFEDPVNIRVPASDVEDWLLINLSADTHPIYLHLPQFQVVRGAPSTLTTTRGRSMRRVRGERPTRILRPSTPAGRCPCRRTTAASRTRSPQTRRS
jgi:FtsP/CotA-like multicopper oxidase with cupredoxin domain